MTRADRDAGAIEQVILEIERAGQTDPHAFRFEAQEYLRRYEDGPPKPAWFEWGDEIAGLVDRVQGEHMDAEAAARLGEAMWNLLDALDWRADERRILDAHEAGRKVRVVLRLAAAELLALPWELVPLGQRGLTLGGLPNGVLVYEWRGTETARADPDPPPEGGRIVLAWEGNVLLADHLGAIRKAHALAGTFAPASPRDRFDEGRDVVGGVSLRRLHAGLAGQNTAILHLLCHGEKVPPPPGGGARETYGLAFRGEDGGPHVVSPAELRDTLLGGLGTLRLVVLAACFGGHGGGLGSRLGSVAHELHKIGIPAVIASRYPLSAEGARELAEALYEGLLIHGKSVEDAFMDARRRLLVRPGSVDWASLQLFARPSDGPLFPFVVCPYRGLSRFEAVHRPFFFGDADKIAEFQGDLDRLLATGDPVRHPRFMVVLGASGTGKSSLVLAGILPGHADRGWKWRCIDVTSWEADLASALAERDRSPGGPGWIFFVDQFEEIFVHEPDPDRRTELVRALWRIAREPPSASGVTVVAIAARIDFLPRLREITLDVDPRDRLEKLANLEQVACHPHHDVLLPGMDAAELRAAIEAPAARVGLALEPGLTELLLADFGPSPGALPLLSHTLRALWERREGRSLTLRAYREVGGLAGALQKTAEGVYSSMDEAEQALLPELLPALVHYGDPERGTADSRRRQSMEELARLLGEQPEKGRIEGVIRRLVAARLLVRGHIRQGVSELSTDTVEVAHEVLLRGWPRLAAWIERGREARRARERLASQAARDALRVSAARAHLPDDPTTAVLLLREVEAEQPESVAGWVACAVEALADPQAHAALPRRHRGVLSALLDREGSAAAVLFDDGAVAVWRPATGEVHEARCGAGARALHLDAEGALVVRNGHGATKVWQGWLTRGTALDDDWQAPPRFAILRRTGRLCSASAGGGFVVIAYPDAVVVWSTSLAVKPAIVSVRSPRTAAVSRDGERLATLGRDGVVRVWALPAGDLAATLRFEGAPGGEEIEQRILGIAVSDDGRCVATRSFRTAAVWDIDHPSSPRCVLRGHVGAITSVVVAPDGRRVVTTSRDWTARVWDAAHGACLATLRGHRAPVRRAVLDATGDRILTCSDDGAARLHAPGEEMRRIALRAPSGASAAAWSADLRRLCTLSLFGDRLQVWDTAQGSLDGEIIVSSRAPANHPSMPPSHAGADLRPASVREAALAMDREGTCIALSREDGARCWRSGVEAGRWEDLAELPPVGSLAFGPGARLAAGLYDGSVLIRSLHRDVSCPPCAVHTGRIATIAWSADGGVIATGSYDRTARRVRVRADDLVLLPEVLGGHESCVRCVALAEDGHLVVTASSKKAYVWTPPWSTPVVLAGHKGDVTAVAVSPDGALVVTASADETLRVWRPRGGAPLAVLRAEGGEVCSVELRKDHLVAVTHDGTAYVYAIESDSARLWLRLWCATPMSLSAKQRCRLLQEDERAAGTNQAHARAVALRARGLCGPGQAEDTAIAELRQAFRAGLTTRAASR